jgi:hypothetical protein
MIWADALTVKNVRRNASQSAGRLKGRGVFISRSGIE